MLCVMNGDARQEEEEKKRSSFFKFSTRTESDITYMEHVTYITHVGSVFPLTSQVTTLVNHESSP